MGTQHAVKFDDLDQPAQRLISLLSRPLGLKSQGDVRFPELQVLKAKFLSLGCSEVEISSHGVFYAHKAQRYVPGDNPLKLGILATYGPAIDAATPSPSWSIRKFVGADLVLSRAPRVTISSVEFPHLNSMLGFDLITGDGTQPLGLSYAVGPSLMLGILEYLFTHPLESHAELYFALVPEGLMHRDEKAFDLEKFKADYAIRLGPGLLGSMVTETFYAGTAKVTMTGHAARPGYEKGELVNAIKPLCEFVHGLPKDESPERTEGRDGFYHPFRIEGGVGEASAYLLIRDHDQDAYEVRKSRLMARAQDYTSRNGLKCEVTIQEDYVNMKPILARSPQVLTLIQNAYRAEHVNPQFVAIRGTHDGARLTLRGCPCPSLGVGVQGEGTLKEYLPLRHLTQMQAILERLVHDSPRFLRLV